MTIEGSGATRRGFVAAVAMVATPTATLAQGPGDRLALTPEDPEGPYYFDAKLIRSDIAENLPGIPLEIRLTVLDQQGRPMKGARVDIWHCDAQGIYSGFTETGEPIPGQTFLRGAQYAGSDGGLIFRTIYPGWYQSRTAHVHFKVFDQGRCPLTAQMYLPDAINEFVYTTAPAYRRQALRDTLNSNDMFRTQAQEAPEAKVAETPDRFVADLTLVVDRTAVSPAARPPPGMKPPFPATVPLLTGDERIAALLPGSQRTKSADR